MKPSRKQNNAGLNKMEKINTYFKTTPKTFAIDDQPEKQCEPTRAFYIRALEEKIQALKNGKPEVNTEFVAEGEDVDGACAVILEKKVSDDIGSAVSSDPKSSTECTGCVESAIAIQEWEMKYKQLKARYMKLAVHSSEMDLKYEDLLKAVISKDQSDVDDIATSSDDIFTTNEIKVLRSIPLDKKSDSSFILKCLEFAYKIDPSVLRFQTLKGVPEWVEITEEGEEIYHAGKAPLSPKNVERIRQIFIERVSIERVIPLLTGTE